MNNLKKIILLIPLFMNSSCENIEKDLDSLCLRAEGIVKNEKLSHEQKYHYFANGILDLELSNDTKKMIVELFAKDSILFNDFEVFAKENGVRNWKCPSLQELIEPANKSEK